MAATPSRAVSTLQTMAASVQDLASLIRPISFLLRAYNYSVV